MIQDGLILQGYEQRDGHNNIMWDIVDALEGGNNYIIEAEVGIGKSFAYLIPSILLSRYTGQPLVVATSSIQLSEQLENDIGNVEKILRSFLEGDQIVRVVGKGRTNYPCIKKIQEQINYFTKIENQKDVAAYKEIMEKVESGADIQNKMGIDDKYRKIITMHTCDESPNNVIGKCPLYKMRKSLKGPMERSAALSIFWKMMIIIKKLELV